MSEVQIQDVSHKHEAIMNFMLANPLTKLGEVAAIHNVSAPWLSVIINSHAFKDKMAQRQNEVFGELNVSINDKLKGIAQVGLDRIAEKVFNSSDENFILSATNSVLKNLGYGVPAQGAGGQTNIQNNTYVVDAQFLESARQNMIGLRPPGAEQQEVGAASKLLEGEVLRVTSE